MVILTPIIITIELFCLLLSASLIYAFLVWRKKNHFIAALDELTGDAAENETERLHSLSDRLESILDLDSQRSEHLGGELARAEKSFLQDLVTLLLRNQHEQISGLKSRIHSLTDGYIDALIELKPGQPANSTDEDAPESSAAEDRVQSPDQNNSQEPNPDSLDTSEPEIKATDDAAEQSDTEDLGAADETISAEDDIETPNNQLEDSEPELAETEVQEATPSEDNNQPQANDSTSDEALDVSVNTANAENASQSEAVEDTTPDKDIPDGDKEIEISVAHEENSESDPAKTKSPQDAETPTMNDQTAESKSDDALEPA